MEINNIYNTDALDGMRVLKAQGFKADLIITDPPYELSNIIAGGNSSLAKSIQPAFNQLDTPALRKTVSHDYLQSMLDLQDTPNIYLWCNGKQIPYYLDFFVKKNNCKLDILI